MAILDDKILLEAKSLMKDKFNLMVDYFVEDTGNYIADINSGFVDCHYDKIRGAAHTIKSSSRQLGALQLSELGKSIEELAKSESRDAIEKILPDLNKIFDETKVALAAA